MYKHVALVAVSGTGKGTVAKALFDLIPDLMHSISCTTRAPRSTEHNGREYYFLSKEEFIRRRDCGRFAEWFLYNDHLYGTLLYEIERIEKLKKPILFDVDINGAMALKKSLGERIVTVFLEAPLDVCEERLRIRGTEKEAYIQNRLKIGKIEFERKDECDHIVWYGKDIDKYFAANTVANLIKIPH